MWDNSGKTTNALVSVMAFFDQSYTVQRPFNGLWSGTTRVGRYQKKHSPTHTHPDQRASFITFLHLQRSTASSFTTNTEQIEVLELAGYSRPTCNKLCESSCDPFERRRCNPQLDRRRVLWTTPSTCHGEIFRVQNLSQSSRGKYPYFWVYPRFLTTQFRIRQRKLSCQNQL